MPRPFRTPALAAYLIATIGCAALGPAALHGALAAAAGTVFEAAPFVLVAEALPLRRRLRRLVPLFGCGCGGAVPGALSVASIGLCWLTFGPGVALARAAVGAALAVRRRSRHAGVEFEAIDAFAELRALALSSAAASVLSGFVTSHLPASRAAPAEAVTAFGFGLLLGFLAPCATAAIAIAASFAPHMPPVAAGILAVGGLVPPLRLRGRGVARPQSSRRGGPSRLNVARIALGIALLMVARSGPRGFVSPRLVPFEGLAGMLALAGLRRESKEASAGIVPALLFVALAAGSPEPAYLANETRLDDAFAGEATAFTGVAHRDGATTILQRFAITCCRIDASAVSVRTATPLAVAAGTWITAKGTLVDSPRGLVLRTSDWRRIDAPADPFVYR